MAPNPGYQVPGRVPVEPYPDSGYWRQQFTGESYYLEGDSYDDFAAAFRVGAEGRQRHPDLGFDEIEPHLRQEWEAAKGPSRIEWERARQAAKRAWERAVEGPSGGDRK